MTMSYLQTKPAELIFTLGALHTLAALILFDGCFTFWAFFSICFYPNKRV